MNDTNKPWAGADCKSAPVCKVLIAYTGTDYKSVPAD